MTPGTRPARGDAAEPGSVEPGLSLATWADAEHLLRARRAALVPVNQPLVLISQIQRSGGTLLNSLLDGHHELHVHPYELQIGHPTKADWPHLDLVAGADAWLELISEPVLERLFGTGYRKRPLMAGDDDHPALPFTIVPSFLERLFRVLCAERPPTSQREVIDHYLTALFNAWMDNQGLRHERKLWVTAFAPRAAWGASRARFRGDYADGRIVALLRDPRAWYASASRFAQHYGSVDEAVALWRRGAEEIAAAKREDPAKVLVITYEALVQDSERVLRDLCGWLGVSWSATLLVPTFNRLPIGPNSSYDLSDARIHAEAAERWRTVLAPDVVAAVADGTLDLHAQVRALADLS